MGLRLRQDGPQSLGLLLFAKLGLPARGRLSVYGGRLFGQPRHLRVRGGQGRLGLGELVSQVQVMPTPLPHGPAQ